MQCARCAFVSGNFTRSLTLRRPPQAFTTSTTYSNTYFFQRFIREIELEDPDVSAGMTWVLLLFANKILSTLASNQLYAYADITMLQVRPPPASPRYPGRMSIPCAVAAALGKGCAKG